MEGVLESLGSNTLFILIACAVVVLVAFAILKRLVKLAIFAVAVLVLFFAYLGYTGQEAPEELTRLKDEAARVAGRTARGVKDKIGSTVDEAATEVANEVSEKVKAAISDGVESGEKAASDTPAGMAAPDAPKSP